MSRVTSNRERRLWLLVGVVVLTIYATLPLAATLAVWLADTGLGAGLFGVCCLIILAAVITQGLRRPPSGPEIGVGLGVAAVYLLVFARMSVPNERTHLVEYGVVAVLIYEALIERQRNGRLVPVPAVLAFVMTSALGTIDEGIQFLLPSRVFELTDILFNVLAAFMAISAMVVLGRVRRDR